MSPTTAANQSSINQSFNSAPAGPVALNNNTLSPEDREKNEELMGLLACLNEQAIKELNS